MNFRYEWTASRETMSFYGVAHDRLATSRGGRQLAVRVTVSTSFVPAGADRLIGVWCIRRPAGREMEPRIEAHVQSERRFDPESSRRHPFPPGVGSPRGITAHP
jgi:hypothetical protein